MENLPQFNTTTAILAWVIGQPFIISIVVNLLKGSPFARNHPKLISNVLGALLTLGEDFLFGIIPGQGLDGAIVALIAGVAQGWTATGAYEHVVKPGVKIIIPPKPPIPPVTRG